MAPPVSVSVEARGRLRVLWAQLEAEACRIETAAYNVPRPWLVAAARKGKVGAARAMARIVAGMPVQPFFSERGIAAFRYLKPVAEVPAAIGGEFDSGDQQQAIVMQAVLINSGRVGRLSREPFGAIFTFHALGRLLDRSGFAADPIAAMFEAHDALLVLPPTEGRKVLDLQHVRLPAAGGAFLATIRHVGTGEAPLVVARTWLSQDQLRDDQAADVSLWHDLIEQTTQLRHPDAGAGS
jgi:hypothetical protein